MLQGTDGGFTGMPPTLVADVDRAPGVEAAGGIKFGSLRVGEKNVPVTAPDATLMNDDLVRIDAVDSGEPVRDPGPGRVYLTDSTATELGLKATRRRSTSSGSSRAPPPRSAGW